MLHDHRFSIWVAFVIGLACFGLIVADVDAWTLLVDNGRHALSVSLLGKEVGGARDREYLDALIELLLPSVGSSPDESSGWITTREVPLNEGIFELHARTRAHLENLLATHEAGFAVVVGGEPVVTVPTAAEARQVVTGLIARFTPQAVEGETLSDLEVRTVERMVVEPALTPRAGVMSADDALSYLLRGTRELRTYRVAPGDVASAIASRHGLTVEEIAKANPGLNPDRIYVGQLLNLIVPRPVVNVQAQYVHVFRRAIPYPVSVTRDPDAFRTLWRVDRQGSVGEKEITEKVVRSNGEIADTSVLKEVVLRWPQVEYVTAGTRRIPEDILGDTFADGNVAQLTSAFGKRGLGFHTGIDWAMPIGTPVHAWKDGAVKLAQWIQGYGYLVILEHPNDMLTYYAHLSRFRVGAGQSVKAGDVIAYSGNTGNSTGPHLHFEIREKGVLTDPLAVLSREHLGIGGP
jgi:murein DD-endopeptidase MepM/ murein hydrolase activator NlpD